MAECTYASRTADKAIFCTECDRVLDAHDIHGLGLCVPFEHDRSLPDARNGENVYRAEDWNLNVGYEGPSYERARDIAGAFARPGTVTCNEQRVAGDGLIGCNDCGEPIYWCHNDNRWHHVNPAHECFLIGAEV